MHIQSQKIVMDLHILGVSLHRNEILTALGDKIETEIENYNNIQTVRSLNIEYVV